MINVKTILYATDFSSYSNLAYFHAVALAESHRAALTVAHVHLPDGVLSRESKPEDQAYWRSQLEQIHPLNGEIRVEHVLLKGNPAKEIINFATSNKVDLIVMGTHGRTGLERLLMGSVAETVLRNAPCSVLIVKMPKPTQEGES